MFRVIGEPQLIKVQTSAKNIIPSGVTTKCTNSNNQNSKQRNKNTHNTNSEVLTIFEHVVADLMFKSCCLLLVRGDNYHLNQHSVFKIEVYLAKITF